MAAPSYYNGTGHPVQFPYSYTCFSTNHNQTDDVTTQMQVVPLLIDLIPRRYLRKTIY